MPSAGRDEDGITGGHGFFFAIDFHGAGAFQDEIKFFAQLVKMAFGRLPYRDGGLGQGLVLHGGIGPVQDAADGAAVLRGEGYLFRKGVDGHADARMVSQRAPRASPSHEL